MLDSLLLLSGNDIPFPQAACTIHQPTLKEISFITETSFFNGLEVFNFSKDLLQQQDKVGLENKSNFDIIMSMISFKNTMTKSTIENVEKFLMLIFPTATEISFEIGRGIKLKFLYNESTYYETFIDNKNFGHFKEMLDEIFCSKRKNTDGESVDYNPGGKRAAEIAAKLKRGRERANAAKGLKKDKIEILCKYALILAIGEHKDINEIMNYTVYQLFSEFEGYENKEQFDKYFKAQLAGAQNLDKVDHWISKIYP